jgi:hypothetical protein
MSLFNSDSIKGHMYISNKIIKTDFSISADLIVRVHTIGTSPRDEDQSHHCQYRNFKYR